jgi:proteic killer suppression protein
MIKTFTHKGLEQFFLTGTKAGIQAMHAKRLRLILAMLDQARHVELRDSACTRRRPIAPASGQ